LLFIRENQQPIFVIYLTIGQFCPCRYCMHPSCNVSKGSIFLLGPVIDWWLLRVCL
jgi:hypothetical protein